MAQKNYDKKTEDLHSKRSTVNSPQDVLVTELTVDRFECRSFNFFYHNFFGPSKKVIHAQLICVFMERIARYFSLEGLSSEGAFLIWFFDKRRTLRNG